MMSTYEIVVALFSTNSAVASSTTEVTTVQTKKVVLKQADSEANALNEAKA